MHRLTALLVVIYCYCLCLTEASTTFEDLALGGCQCKSCNCGSVTQECPLQHKSKKNNHYNYCIAPVLHVSLQDLSLVSVSCYLVDVHVKVVLVARFWMLQIAQRVS